MSLCKKLNSRTNRLKDYKLLKLNMPLIEGQTLDAYLKDYSSLTTNDYINLIKSFLLFINYY
jgi:hypothetical protein